MYPTIPIFSIVIALCLLSILTTFAIYDWWHKRTTPHGPYYKIAQLQADLKKEKTAKLNMWKDLLVQMERDQLPLGDNISIDCQGVNLALDSELEKLKKIMLEAADVCECATHGDGITFNDLLIVTKRLREPFQSFDDFISDINEKITEIFAIPTEEPEQEPTPICTVLNPILCGGELVPSGKYHECLNCGLTYARIEDATTSEPGNPQFTYAICPKSDSELSRWFGLSYASFLVLPRVLMEAMPMEWHDRAAELLFQFDEAYPNLAYLETSVTAKRDGKFVKMPEWLKNYRHPDVAMIKMVKCKLGD